MTKKAFTVLIVFFGLTSYGQNNKNHFIGLNIFQLPSSTINFNYSIDYKPFLTPVADVGYALGYNEDFDLIGMFLTPHIKLYDGYSIEKQSGGYIKLGAFFNLRKDFKKQNFFHFGLFLATSMVYEKAWYLSPLHPGPYIYAEKIEHSVYLYGFSASLGYEFKISNRLRTNADFQLSFPSGEYIDLYSYSNFIPGMGFKDTNAKWFPMLILNLKYRL